MEPQKITELAKLLRNNGDKILSSEFTLTLSGALLRALNDSFTLIAESSDIVTVTPQTFQVLKPINSKSPVFRDLQLVYDFVQKTTLLCIVLYPGEEYFEGTIDISKFRALKRLEVQKTNVLQIVGIQPLRSQLQEIICVKSLRNVQDIITHCGGDHSNGFMWNELKVADFSHNNLQTINTSLEFAQFLQHLNLRHNQLRSVDAIKWLPQLKTLDLSYNRLQCIPQFHMEACKRLQSLNMSNNFVEDLFGIAKLDALTDLDLADNCLLDHTYLLPLSMLMTLKYLNLYGNPLHCHPKHRLATAQYLHKNTATVKFILDLEPLSKSEKAATGSQKLRHVGSLNRYATKSTSSVSISSSRTASLSHTPASSVGSMRSFKFQDTIAEAQLPVATAVEASSARKLRSFKSRTVEIEEPEYNAEDSADAAEGTQAAAAAAPIVEQSSTSAMKKSLIDTPDTEHLEAKRQVEALREKYGAAWLHSANTEMMQSMQGSVSASDVEQSDVERHKARQLFQDFIGELTDVAPVDNSAASEQTLNASIRTSTPTNDSMLRDDKKFAAIASPIRRSDQAENASENTLYMSLDNKSNDTVYSYNNNNNEGNTFYKTANDSGLRLMIDTEPKKVEGSEVEQSEKKDEQDEDARFKNIYSTTTDEDDEVSEPEDDEETYIVYTTNRNEAIFLTLSSKCLRERDTLTQRTKTKWSLKILESCDRIKSNTLRINFDTVITNKKERIYTVEDGLCQELEKKLRDILSQRDLTEMNQTIYRCVNCTCQFSRENKYRLQHAAVRCPDCKSTFVAEIHDVVPAPVSHASSLSYDKLSPAAIVEESPVTTPLILQPDPWHKPEYNEETTSIGSANSLNGSSSCSKITNSQSSFDSNQSVVGSSNTDRDNEFRSNCESDVDILSNPSQSSIEVLDQMVHSGQQRKTSSEERRISQIPNLETIDDHSYTQTFIDREFGNLVERGMASMQADSGKDEHTVSVSPAKAPKKAAPTAALAHLNLTESSSSGSVTDSVCTAYEQAEKSVMPEQPVQQDKIVIHNLLTAEAAQQSLASPAVAKREDTGISSVLGALFQSTNLLMSSSKKLIDAEASANVQTGTTTTPTGAQSPACRPYNFSYSNFNEIDHRLKLYFYASKFEEQGEHFKWLARGRIYNEQTHTLCDGLVLVSTCKVYLMEAFAPQDDDVTKWLRPVVSVTVDRLTSIQLLPWKIGLAFTLRDWGGFLLLLQDILRTDSLLLFFANNALPAQCELIYQPAEQLQQRLSAAVGNAQLKMCSLLNDCDVTCDQAKRSFSICTLLTTDTHLFVTSSKVAWLSLQTHPIVEPELELCVTQYMSNLVEVERLAANAFIINFLDETQDKCELWKCTFETKENADSCLNAIAQSWEQLFGVSLLNA